MRRPVAAAEPAGPAEQPVAPSSSALTPVLASVVGVVMTASFPVVLTGALSVQMRDDLGFDNGTLGAAVTCYYLISALVSTVSGRLSERISAQRTLQAAAVLGALASAGIALADRFAVFVVFLGIGGVSLALAHPASNAVIVDRVPRHRRGLAFGIKQSSIPGGTALAGIAVPVIGLTVGWPWAFAGAAAVSLLAAATVPASAPRTPTTRSRPDGLQGSYGELVVLATAAALAAAPAMSMPVFLTAAAVERDFSTAAAGALLAVGSIGGLLVRVVAGSRADRRVGGHLRPIAILMGLGTIGLASMATDQPIVFTVGTALAFGAGWAWQGLFNHAVTNRWASSAASATGITQAGVFVGGIIGPPTFGWVASRGSDAAGWLVLGGMMAAATGMVLSVQRWSSPTVDPRTPLEVP